MLETIAVVLFIIVAVCINRALFWKKEYVHQKALVSVLRNRLGDRQDDSELKHRMEERINIPKNYKVWCKESEGMFESIYGCSFDDYKAKCSSDTVKISLEAMRDHDIITTKSRTQLKDELSKCTDEEINMIIDIIGELKSNNHNHENNTRNKD